MVLSASTDIENGDGSDSVTGISASVGYQEDGATLPTLVGPGVVSLTFPEFGDFEVNLAGAATIAPSATEAYSGGPTTSNPLLASSVNIDLANFGLYTDTSVSFDVDGKGATTISSSGGLPTFTNLSLTGGIKFTVTYIYTAVPIPEPSSTALLGFGGLALIMRRRR
ncbi:MAG: hypothetical protein ACI9E1_002402 [Cryomorphaceae bacterium]|jgi:hypothetical protein